MKKMDLAHAKLHLRIDPEDTEEDALISGWIPAAYLAIEGKIFRKLYEDEASIPEGSTGIVIDEGIQSIAQLILGNLYFNRESAAPGQAAEMLLGLMDPYINTAGGF